MPEICGEPSPAQAVPPPALRSGGRRSVGAIAKSTAAMSIWVKGFGFMGGGLRRAFGVAARVVAID
jgi:hypothetical protein